MTNIYRYDNKIILNNNKVAISDFCCCDFCDCLSDLGTYCEVTNNRFIWITILPNNISTECPGASINPIQLIPYNGEGYNEPLTNPLILGLAGNGDFWQRSFQRGIFFDYFTLECISPSNGGSGRWKLEGSFNPPNLFWSMSITFDNIPQKNPCSINGMTGSGTITWSYIEIDGVSCNGTVNITASISTVGNCSDVG